MFQHLPQYSERSEVKFWDAQVPAHWGAAPGLAVIEQNKCKNTNLAETQVLSLSYGRVVVKPVEKQHGLVPESYEGYQVLDPGDIVIRPTDLQNDKTSIRVGMVHDRGIITSAYIGLRPKGSWSAAYAHAYLATVDSTKRLYGMGSGLRQQLGWDDLKRMLCLVPPADEQAAIVKYLANANARIDKAVTARRHLITLLEEQNRTWMRDLITSVGSDSAKRKDSGLHWIGNIPEHWEVRKLRSLFRYQGSGTTPSGEQYYGGSHSWVMSGDLNDGVVSGTARTVTDAAIEEVSSLREHPEGSLVIAMYGASIGKTGLLAMPASTNQACAVLSEARAGVDPRYVQSVVRVGRPAFQELGTGGGQPNINGEKVAQFRIPVPPLSEQKSIVGLLGKEEESLHYRLSVVRREIGLLNEFRTRLVSDVVTGQIDVRVIAESLPEVDLDDWGGAAFVDGSDPADFDHAVVAIED